MKASMLASGALLLAATASQAAEPASPNLGAIGTSLIAVVAHGASTLAVIPAGGGDYDTLWAAWGDDDVNPRTIHLALLRRSGTQASATWAMQRDGYAPTLAGIGDWDAAAHGVLLLRYQSGAALSHAEIYRIDAKAGPILVGELEGSLIRQSVRDGSTAIEVYEGADLRQPPTCYGWDEAHGALHAEDCAGKSGQP